MRKEIIFMIEIAGMGGICHYTYNLCNAISRKIPTLLITGKGYELSNMAKSFNYLELFNKFKTNPLNILKLIGLIKHKKPQVVHFQLSQYPEFILFLSILVKLFSSSKIYITSHNVLSHEKKKFTKVIFTLIYRLASVIIVHAKANKEELLNIINIDENKVKVIPHGNYLFFNAQNSDTRPVESAPPKEIDASRYILFFGYIRKYKGLSYLLKAMAEVVKELSDARLIIAGKPVESFKPYQQEIEALGITNNVILDLSYIPFEKVKEYFKQCEVVVMPYIKVYQSGVIQLAYGFSKPVIVTDTGGMAEAVKDGETGYVIEPGDVDGLVTAIKKIIKNRDIAKEMGNNANHLAATEFSWDNIADMTLSAYKNN